MVLPFTHIHPVGGDVGAYDKNRLGVTADPETLALPERVELRALVAADYFPVRVILPAGLLDMFLSRTVSL